MTVLSMSEKEFPRLDVLLGVEVGRLPIRDACALMGLRRRQVFRLLAAFRADGISSLVLAKGRVERSFGTLQDRLVQELRLAGVSTPEAANAFLRGFLERHNARFGKTPFDASDGHRPLPVDDGSPTSLPGTEVVAMIGPETANGSAR